MKSNIKIISWQELEKINSSPILILGSREISSDRITQLTTQLLKNTNKQIVWGVFTENYVQGLENSPQFKTLDIETLKTSLKLINSHDRINVLEYPQTQTLTILLNHNWSAIIGINGSWHRAFHYREEYQVIKKLKIPFKFVSAFIDEEEALQYEAKILKKKPALSVNFGEKCTEKKIFELVDEVARYSFDNTWQTGAVLTRNGMFLLATYNKIVPFETYALLYGASKEKHQAPPQDLNHYDTNHAEVEIILEATKREIKLEDCSLFINLMPCPICSRMLAQTAIKEVVYRNPHSNNYAITILEKAGKTIRQIET